MTAASRAGAVLVFLATAFIAWTTVRAEAGSGLVAAVLLLGTLVLGVQVSGWHRARHLPVRHLEARPDGSIWLRQAGQGAVKVRVGAGTRLLGPSVFLDLQVESAPSPGRLRCWISPLDAPRHVLRRWSVVLPLCGRVACT